MNASVTVVREALDSELRQVAHILKKLLKA